MSAGASCAGTAAPSSGEMYCRSVQPAADDDQRETEWRVSEGGKLPGKSAHRQRHIVSPIRKKTH